MFNIVPVLLEEWSFAVYMFSLSLLRIIIISHVQAFWLGRIGLGVTFKIFTTRLGLSVRISKIHFKKQSLQSRFLSLSLCLCLLLFHSLYIALSLSLSLSLFLCLSFFISDSIRLFLVCLKLSFSLFLSLYIFLSLCVFLSLSYFLSLSHVLSDCSFIIKC